MSGPAAVPGSWRGTWRGTWRGALEPRDRHRATRAASTLLLTAAAVTAVSVALVPPTGARPTVLLTAANPLVQVVLALLVRRSTGRGPFLAWTLPALLGIVLITALDVLTGDASAAAQVYFCFPVLYAGSQLRPPAAYGVLACTLVGDVVVNASLLPPAPALDTAVVVGATLTAITALLVRAGQYQDQLTAGLRRQAAFDPLTGLVTRRVLDDAAATALRSAAHHEGTALVLVDIDRFKTVNDTHGHPAGDAALVHVAGLLGTLCRPDDVLSRLGGDEIALLLPGCSARAALERAELLAIAVRETPLVTVEGTVALTVSVGVAHAPTDATDLRRLYAAADSVLYDAKRSGRDRVGHSG